MTEGIIIALITGACAVIGQYLITRQNREAVAADRAKKDERTDQRLQRIEEKLDEQSARIDGLSVQVREHNGLKQDIAEIKTEIRNLKERQS